MGSLPWPHTTSPVLLSLSLSLSSLSLSLCGLLRLSVLCALRLVNLLAAFLPTLFYLPQRRCRLRCSFCFSSSVFPLLFFCFCLLQMKMNGKQVSRTLVMSYMAEYQRKVMASKINLSRGIKFIFVYRR